MSLKNVKTKLDNYHRKRATVCLTDFSDIAGNQFQGEFNVSGFHRQILNLSDREQSIWGVDRCMRIQEVVDPLHSYIFHMAIFAKSVDLKNNFINPFNDERFFELQKTIILQFLEVLSLFGVNLNEVEMSYFGGLSFGGEGKFGLLRKKYEFPPDLISKKILGDKVELFPVKTIANIDINAGDGSLVGPRLEVAYKGIEIGTIVFDCFKVKQGCLFPINYVAGYAIGIERLTAATKKQDLIEAVPRYNGAIKLLQRNIAAAKSSLFKKEVMALIFAAEVLALASNKLSKKQKERLRELKKGIRKNMENLGVDGKQFDTLINFFKKWNYL